MGGNQSTHDPLDSFIDDLLANPDVNRRCVPDGIERMVYKRFLRFLLEAIRANLQSASIRFLNHEIVFTLRPIEAMVAGSEG